MSEHIDLSLYKHVEIAIKAKVGYVAKDGSGMEKLWRADLVIAREEGDTYRIIKDRYAEPGRTNVIITEEDLFLIGL